MPNYNVSVEVDPSRAEAGVRVVESGLNRVETRAASMRSTLQRAFDFNAGPATSSASVVDKALEGVKSSATAAAAAVFKVNDSLRVLSAPSATAAAGLKQVNENLIRLYGTSEQQVRSNTRMVASQGQVRASTLSLGAQFNDFSTQVLAGGSVITAFAQQSGQAAYALQGMGGKLGAVGSFLAGPWGTILIIATTVLAGFIANLLKSNGELQDAIDKLKEDGRQTEINRQAKEAYNRTLEGQIALQRELNKELDKSILTQRQLSQQTLLSTQGNLANLRSSRPGLVKSIGDQEGTVASYRNQIEHPSGSDPEAMLGIVAAAAAAEDKLKSLKAQLTTLDRSIVDGERAVREAQQPLIQGEVEASLDRKTAATLRYTQALGNLNAKLAIGAGNTRRVKEYQSDGSFQDKTIAGISPEQYRRELARISKQRDDAIEAAAKADRASHAGDGVSRFRSQSQAVGIAGRELQGSGLRVSENEQFGGITAGVHQSSHKNAIDVNSGTGITEANIPDLRQRFDQLALRYQERGYRVLWNGQVYEPGGHGPSGPIKGSDKHLDHMHIEAPQSIVGKATGGSTESQAEREYKTQQVQLEQQRDFVGGIVSNAAARGQGNQAETVQAQIEKVYADYKRRFNADPSDGDKKKIADALTEAQAREIALHFQQAYVDPLDRLRQLQGLTGEAREILNRKLEESARLGRELTPVEAKQIEDGVALGDALSRQAAILDSVRRPQEDYAQRIADLNKLLETGQINQTSYNSAVSDLGSAARNSIRDLPGSDPNTGQSYSDLAATSEEDARYAHELQAYQDNRAQLLAMGLDYDHLVEEAEKRHQSKINAIQVATAQTRLGYAQQAADSLLGVAETYAGKQSGIYKGIFLVSKAFAIAQAVLALQQNIAEASKYGFPQNIPFIAGAIAQGASILTNIAAISAQFRTGGYTGDGDPGAVAGVVHGREFVMNERATANNRAELEAMNAGRPARQAAAQRKATNDNAAAPRPVNVHIDASDAPGVEFNTGQVTEDMVEIIATRIVARDTPKLVAGEVRNPNSRTSKALSAATTARRKRA